MEGMQISQVRVISEAKPPVQPTWPKPKLLLAVSAALGLMLGCALALMMGARDRAHESLLAGAWPRRKPSGAPEAAPAGALPNRPRDLPVLGAVRLPFAEGGLAGGIRALRTEMRRFRNTALLRSVEQLLVAITDRLRPGVKPPFVLLVSSLRNGGERHMAAAAIGIGLDHIHQKVLVVDLVAALQQPASPVLAGLRAAPFIDPSSGLRTMVADIDPLAVRTSEAASRLVDDWVARAAAPVDFAIIIDRPFGDPARSAGLAARADLIVFALGPNDRESGGDEWLRDRLAPDELARSTALVIEMESQGTGATDTRRPHVAANTGHPRGAITTAQA
jgi:hypothetical protein